MFRTLLSCFVVVAGLTLEGAPAEAAIDVSDEQVGKTPTLLTLPMALTFMRERSPWLKSVELETEATEAEVSQAWAIPNPELSYQVENFDGSGVYEGGALREETLTLSQRIETGGKWGDRIALATTRAEVAGIEGEIVMQEATTLTVIHFVTALANQLRMQNAKEMFALAEELVKAAKARVEAGKEPPYFSISANALLFGAKADYERAKNEFILSRRRLAALWGENDPAFDRLSGNLELIGRPPTQQQVMEKAADYPRVRRHRLATVVAKAESEKQAGLRWPDLTLSVGERRLPGTGDRTYVAGASVAIPLFDRNQGTARAAKIRALRAEEELRISDLDLRLEIESALSGVWTAYHELESYRHAGLLAGREAMRAATEGYREGKMTYVEALEARRALAETQSRYIDTLERYHTLRARLYELTGKAVEISGRWLTEGSEQ